MNDYKRIRISPTYSRLRSIFAVVSLGVISALAVSYNCGETKPSGSKPSHQAVLPQRKTLDAHNPKQTSSTRTSSNQGERPVGYAPNDYFFLLNRHKEPVPCGPVRGADLVVRKADRCVLVLDTRGESGGGPLVIREIPLTSSDYFDLQIDFNVQMDDKMRASGLSSKEILSAKTGRQHCPLGFRLLVQTGGETAPYVATEYIHLGADRYFRKSDNCVLSFSGGRFCEPSKTSSTASFYETPIFEGHFDAQVADALKRFGVPQDEIERCTEKLLLCSGGFRKLIME